MASLRTKSYLRNLVAFHGGVTASVGKVRATDVICLSLCKAVDTDLLIGKAWTW